ncbi:MAG TPA: L-histidine N(alpha)-methyltransferase [Vicinamibacterales bacterium]|jgi:L-histidine Nalpha-methyltransferase|nr:L-histidine N(alpha)-methyltransferase [Vicinamibacterales bacterium]
MLLSLDGIGLSARTDFVSDVADYLQRTPRQLPSRYFYDALGSALFDAICRLPWYQVTRAETALLARHARAMLEPLRRPLNITELGCGNGEKLAVLLEKGGERLRRVHLIDISGAALMSARARLATLPSMPVTAFQGTYEQGLARLATHRSHGNWLVLFLGSNIGNFDPPAARDMLRRIRGSLTEGDALLLGTDLVKSPRVLQLAYDDPLQVTAAFNRNLLRRINDELGGTFDLDGFAHRALWNPSESRIEMHLVSTRQQLVRISEADLEIEFKKNEWIWTESSYKYDPDQVLAQGRDAGFQLGEQWIDENARFALTLFKV